MISWMTKQDDEKAYKKHCSDCRFKMMNSSHGNMIPCITHELEYASTEVPVIECHFLDGENPQLGKDLINKIIIDPESNISWLIDHVDAEAQEGRDTVLQLRIKTMSRDDLNTLDDWEP